MSSDDEDDGQKDPGEVSLLGPFLPLLHQEEQLPIIGKRMCTKNW